MTIVKIWMTPDIASGGRDGYIVRTLALKTGPRSRTTRYSKLRLEKPSRRTDFCDKLPQHKTIQAQGFEALGLESAIQVFRRQFVD
jgi:hypothetical protein